MLRSNARNWQSFSIKIQEQKWLSYDQRQNRSKFQSPELRDLAHPKHVSVIPLFENLIHDLRQNHVVYVDIDHKWSLPWLRPHAADMIKGNLKENKAIIEQYHPQIAKFLTCSCSCMLILLVIRSRHTERQRIHPNINQQGYRTGTTFYEFLLLFHLYMFDVDLSFSDLKMLIYIVIIWINITQSNLDLPRKAKQTVLYIPSV